MLQLQDQLLLSRLAVGQAVSIIARKETCCEDMDWLKADFVVRKGTDWLKETLL